MDTALLRKSFDAVAGHGAELAEYFYAYLFAAGGEQVEHMFPMVMVPQQDRLLDALVRIITDVDELEKLTAYLAGLGQDHRKFGVRREHFTLVGKALLATLAKYAGDAWTPQVAETWAGAYALVAEVMVQALEADDGKPMWWDAEITGTARRSLYITALTVRLDQPMTWAPGQSVAVRVASSRIPDARVWRFLSPANTPRPSRTVEFHVRAVPGGLLSPALAWTAEPGTRLRLGPPVGSLQLDESSQRDVLMMAGSTGLAPMLAMIERLASRPEPPAVALFFGARQPGGLYELERLAQLAREHRWLTLTHAVDAPEEETPGYDGMHGSIVDVAAQGGRWEDRDAYICGPSSMVQVACRRLASLGIPGVRIHKEDFGWEG